MYAAHLATSSGETGPPAGQLFKGHAAHARATVHFGLPVRVLWVANDPAEDGKLAASTLRSDLRLVLVGQGAGLKQGRLLVRNECFDVLLLATQGNDSASHGKPGNPDLELVSLARQRPSPAEVIVFSSVENDGLALQAFASGAAGFVVANAQGSDLVQAVLQVAGGGAAISPGLARRLLSRLEQPPATNGSGLSVREREILGMVAAGYTSHEVGLHLDLSGHTVNTHLRNVYRKLKVHTRAQAVSRASHFGLLRP